MMATIELSDETVEEIVRRELTRALGDCLISEPWCVEDQEYNDEIIPALMLVIRHYSVEVDD